MHGKVLPACMQMMWTVFGQSQFVQVARSLATWAAKAELAELRVATLPGSQLHDLTVHCWWRLGAAWRLPRVCCGGRPTTGWVQEQVLKRVTRGAVTRVHGYIKQIPKPQSHKQNSTPTLHWQRNTTPCYQAVRMKPPTHVHCAALHVCASAACSHIAL